MRSWQRAYAGMLALGIIAAMFLAVPGVRVEAVAAPTHDQAVGVLQLYFKDLNQKKYREAYALRGASLQRKQSYASFTAGFSRTAQNSLKVTGTTANGTQTIVHCQLSATLMSGAQQSFRGSYTIGRENGRFRITSANLTVVA